MDLVRIATLNARGLANNIKQLKLDYFLSQSQIDVCFLQETNVKVDKICSTYGTYSFVPATRHQSGLGLWVKNTSSFIIVDVFDVVPSSLQEVTLTNGEDITRFWNIHLPHSNIEARTLCETWAKRLEDLGYKAKALNKGGLQDQVDTGDMDTESIDSASVNMLPNNARVHLSSFVIGDFNVAFDPLKDTLFGSQRRAGIVKMLEDVMVLLDVVDIQRAMFPDSHMCTHDNARLDYIFIPRTLVLGVKSMDIVEVDDTDHKMVYVSFAHPCHHRLHAPYWLFRNDMLSDSHYCEE